MTDSKSTTTTTPTDEKFGSLVDANETTKLGRPVDPTSKRQIELRNKAVNPNATGKQGRPVEPTSERQIRLLEEAKRKGFDSVAAYEAAKKDGTITKGKQGRPVDPTSPRQLALAERLEREKKRAEAWALINKGKVDITVEATTETPVEDVVSEDVVSEDVVSEGEVEMPNATSKKGKK